MQKRLSLATILILGFWGCQQNTDDTNAIKVGVVLPLTGTFADNGERHRAAIQMAFQDIEAAGGVRGQSVRAVVVDCGGDRATADARLEATLGTWDNPKQPVRAIISSSTACHEASLPFSLRQKIPHLEVSSGSDYEEVAGYTLPDQTGLDRSYELQVRALCNAEAVMTPTFLSMRPEFKKVVIMRGSHTHDIMHTTTVRAELPASGFADAGQVVVNDADVVMPNDGPYTQAISEALALNPDTLYFHLNGDTRNINFLSELKRSGFTGKIVTCGMIRKPIVLDPVSPGFIDFIGNRLFFMMRGPVGSPELTTFKAAYKTYFGKDADTFAASAYDAAMLTALGLAATSSTEGQALRDAIIQVARDGTQVKYGETARALELLKANTNLNYDGASGTLDFHADQSVPSRFYVEEVLFDAAKNTGSFHELDAPVVFK